MTATLEKKNTHPATVVITFDWVVLVVQESCISRLTTLCYPMAIDSSSCADYFFFNLKAGQPRDMFLLILFIWCVEAKISF